MIKTARAEVIEACEAAAETSGHRIIAHMPRMAEFYRKRVNEQLRSARRCDDSATLADAKAKLELLRWAEGWMRGPVDSWPTGGPKGRDHAYRMNTDLSMIGFALRHLIQAYADHPKFRPEWRIER